MLTTLKRADGTDPVLMWIQLSNIKYGYLQFSNVLSLCFPPQMQQQELAQMRQRDANLTALAAIGPRKKRKLDSPGGATAGTEVRDETSYIHSVTAFTVVSPAVGSSVAIVSRYILFLSHHLN